MSKVLKGVAIAAALVFAIPIAAIVAPGLLTAGFVSVVNAMAVTALISGVLSQLQPGPPRPSTTTEYSGTVEARRLIYGTMKVSGMNVIPPVTSGTNNQYLHQVLAVAGHEVAGITDVYFNQDLIASASISSVTGTSNDGKVTSGSYANKAWIRRYLGTSTQTADYILDNALTIWDSTKTGRGVAYLAVQFSFDDTVFKTGKPEVSCIVQGFKVYDPRLDSTNGGVGSQRVADPTTWAYSSNPALCLAHYLCDNTVGMGETTDRIDWAMVADAADNCDETVTVPDGSGGSTTQTRYTCNTVLYATQAYEENIGILVGSMLGTCLYSGGKWRIRAGVWATNSFTIGDANIVDGGVDYVSALPYKDRYNGIRGSFTDPNNNYQQTEFPATQSATYVSSDGESAFKDVRLDACTNVYEAQRAAILLTRKSRNKQSATLRCDMSAWRVRPGETGLVTITELGWVNKSVRCEAWKFNPAGFVELSVREELSSDWSDPILTDYTDPTHISNPTPVYFKPDAPSGLTATASLNSINLSWVAPALMPYSAQYEVWEYTASTPFSAATKVWSGNTTSCSLPKTDTVTRYYWVLVRMPDGTASDTYPASAGISGSAGSIFYGNLTVPAATLAADSSGTVASFAPASGTYKTYNSGVDITTGNGVVYAMTASSNCTATINSSTGAYSVSAMTADYATATFSATYNSAVITAILTLAKAKAGSSSSAATTIAYLTVPSVDLMAYADGTVDTFGPAAGQIKMYSGGVDVTSSGTYAVTAQNSLTGSVTSGGAYSVTALSADAGSLEMTATYSGSTFALKFTVTRSRVGIQIWTGGALPTTGNFQGRMVFWTSDNKLYRYDGSAWTKAADGADITAGTITGNALVAGTITGAKIASTTITSANIDTRNLTIKDASGNIIFGSGASINPSSYLSVPNGWLNNQITISGGTISGIGTGSGTAVANSAISISSSGVLSGAGGGTVSLSGLGAGAFAYLSQINTSNVSTYIASAAIGNAQIGSLAVGTLQIQDQAVSIFNSAQHVIYGSSSATDSVYMAAPGTITFLANYRPFGTIGSTSTSDSSVTESTTGASSSFSSPFAGTVACALTRIHNLTITASSAGWYYFTCNSTLTNITGTPGAVFDNQILIRYK